MTQTPQITGTGGSEPLGSSGVAVFKTSESPVATLARTVLTEGPRGGVTVEVACPAGGASCEGTVSVQALGAAAARFASGHFAVAAGTTARVRLHLSAKARRLLARRRALRVKVVIAAAGARTGTATAVLRAPPRRRR